MDDHGHRERFPGLKLAWDTLNGTPGSCAVLNAANEIAVDAFLKHRIRFDQIHHVNEAALNAVVSARPENLEDLLGLDRRSREAARTVVARLG
jgi:1-deoxy-D-xylulose-5-phosphate reductoisomerase